MADSASLTDIGDHKPFSNEKGTDPFWISEEQLIEDLEDEGRLYPREWYDWLFNLLRLGAMAPRDQDA